MLSYHHSDIVNVRGLRLGYGISKVTLRLQRLQHWSRWEAAGPSGAEGKWSWNPEVITTCLSGHLCNGPHVDVTASDHALAPQHCSSSSITQTETESEWECGDGGGGDTEKRDCLGGMSQFSTQWMKMITVGIPCCISFSLKDRFNKQLCMLCHWWRHGSIFIHQKALLPLMSTRHSESAEMHSLEMFHPASFQLHRGL